MADFDLRLPEIFNHIANLLSRIRKVERQLKLDDKLEFLDEGEQPQDGSGGLPFAEALYMVPVCKVTTITSDQGFRGRIQVPSDDANGWQNDSVITGEVDVFVPAYGSMPSVGEYVGVRFTGLFQRFTAGTTISLPRYGLLGPYRDTHQARVKAIGDNSLTCVFWDGVTEGSTITVAKPYKLRRTTVEGAGYTWSSAQQFTDDSDDFLVTESYVVDDLIYVDRPVNGTGITSVVWVDKNYDGRAWAKDVE